MYFPQWTFTVSLNWIDGEMKGTEKLSSKNSAGKKKTKKDGETKQNSSEEHKTIRNRRKT